MKQQKRILAALMAAAMAVTIMGCAAADQEPPVASSETTAPAEVVAQPLADSSTQVVQQAPDFSDVSEGAWYRQAALWCRDNGIMNGTGETTFSPEATMTRAMLATVLYRAAGSPQTTNNVTFPDVPADAYYYAAASWAGENGIVTGYANGLFGSDDPITREQLATILWRYDGSPAAEAGESFTDETRIAGYASAAVDWARASGIISGLSDGSFNPLGNATRAQVAVILFRYLTAGQPPVTETPEPEPEPEPSQLPQSVVTNSGEEIALTSLEHQSADADSTVYFISDITPESLITIYEALDWSPTGSMAVKLSTGEPPASNYLDPNLIADLVHEVDGTIVECNTAYGGSRSSTAMHYQVAEDHGFTAIADVVIMDEDGSITLPVTGGSVLTENYVGAHFNDYDSFLVLSHFKGHAMAGYGGAIKNISIGIASSEGKSLIHSGGTGGSMFGGDQDAFLEAMAEAGKSVSDALNNGERMIYISVMNHLSVDCDCDGNPAEPDMHDIGILASTDPVAIDQACIDLVYAAENGDSLAQRIESRNGLHTLEHAAEIGLGSRTYSLVPIS